MYICMYGFIHGRGRGVHSSEIRGECTSLVWICPVLSGIIRSTTYVSNDEYIRLLKNYGNMGMWEYVFDRRDQTCLDSFAHIYPPDNPVL